MSNVEADTRGACVSLLSLLQDSCHVHAANLDGQRHATLGKADGLIHLPGKAYQSQDLGLIVQTLGLYSKVRHGTMVCYD